MKLLRALVVTAAALSLFSASAAALDVPPVPRDIPIVDNAEVLTPEQEQTLAGKIAAERTNSGNQIAVLTIPSLQGEVLEEYSLKVARDWGIGTKERNNGVLLLVAVNDRRLRIEVGYGLEGALPDIRANQIIRDRITPPFKAGNYYAGIDSGVDGIIKAIHNERDPALKNESQRDRIPALPWEFIFFVILFVPSWLAAMLARTKSWWAGGVLGGVVGLIIVFIIGLTVIGIASLLSLVVVGLLFDRAVSRNFYRRKQEGLAPSWWAGGTHIGGGGGSGGFGGFGGGSFGGGGSSGSW